MHYESHLRDPGTRYFPLHVHRTDQIRINRLSLCKLKPRACRCGAAPGGAGRLVQMSTAPVAAPTHPHERAPAIDVLTVNAVLIAVRQAANVLCDRWSLVTLLLAQAGVHRFKDFSEISGMASRLLTSRLATLEQQEIVVRLPYTRRPPRYDYHLSHMGLALFDVFATMARWEQAWHPGAGGASLRIEHLACGATDAHPTPRCASCDTVLVATDIQLTVSQRQIQSIPAKPTVYRRSTLSTVKRGLGVPLPLAHAIDVFGDKWGIELVMCLFTRVRQFKDFQMHLGISTNILADRLARLGALGILRATTGADRFGPGAYALTDKGIALAPILLAIQVWADEWLRDRVRSPVKFVHRPCGQPLVMRVSCDRCGQALARANSRLTISR